jgi:hypothetical protein
MGDAMKRFKCNYVLKDRPESMEVWAKEAQEAVCEAIAQLSGSDYRRLEISDEDGIIYFRQGPSRCMPAFRKFVRNTSPYIIRAGIEQPLAY